MSLKIRGLLAGLGFGIAMTLAFLLMGFSLMRSVLSGLGAGLFFGLTMSIIATRQRKKSEGQDKAEVEARMSRDIIFQLILGSAFTIIGILCAIWKVWYGRKFWFFFIGLGVLNIVIGFTRKKKL